MVILGPILYAVIIFYFQSDVTETGSEIIDQPGNLILGHYDFIIVGGGSAVADLNYRAWTGLDMSDRAPAVWAHLAKIIGLTLALINT